MLGSVHRDNSRLTADDCTGVMRHFFFHLEVGMTCNSEVSNLFVLNALMVGPPISLTL